MRVCYYDNKGNEVTKYFFEEGNFIADIHNYNGQCPATEYIQAVTDCKYISLSRDTMKDFSMTIVEWDNILAKNITKGLAENVNKISAMMPEDATERYLSFLEKFPSLTNHLPLNQLASYLGITQSSLSRIRKKIKI